MPSRKRPIRLEDLFELKALGHVAISPDDATVVYEVKRCDPGENKNFVQLWRVAVPAAGEEPASPEPLTSGGKWNDSLPKFSPDGSRIAFLSTRDKGSCLFVLPLGGGEPRRLTAPDGFVHDFDWSPDGRRLVFVYQPMSEREKLERDGNSDELTRRPQFKHITRLFHKLDGAGWWNGQYRHLHVISATGGKARQLTFGNYDDSSPRWSPNGRLIAFVSNRLENADVSPENADLFVVKPTGGPIRKITEKKGSCGGIAWSPSSKHIAYVGNPGASPDSWKFASTIWIADVTGGKPRCVTPRFEDECYNTTIGDVVNAGFEPASVLWSEDEARLRFVVSRRGETHLYSCASAGGDVRAELVGHFNIYFMDQSRPGGLIALASGNATNPGDVHIARPEEQRAGRGSLTTWDVTRLTAINQSLLDRIALAEPEEFVARSRGAEVHGWLMKPPGFAKGRKYPAILEIHGGPHAQYGVSFFHEMQWLAALGYVVCYSNPRGSTGYGLKFRRCIHADWGHLDYIDVLAVADWFAARPFVDRKRMGVTGGSYGGFMTNWIVGQTNRFKAAVTQRSVVNNESMCGTSDFGWDFGHELGGWPWQRAERLRAQSPLRFVKNIRTPLLIEHEEQDHRCPIEQAEQLFTALKLLGRTVELVRFEGESHGMSRIGRPQNRAERLRRIADWFKRYLW